MMPYLDLDTRTSKDGLGPGGTSPGQGDTQGLPILVPTLGRLLGLTLDSRLLGATQARQPLAVILGRHQVPIQAPVGLAPTLGPHLGPTLGPLPTVHPLDR